jgi:hypothetical protein
VGRDAIGFRQSVVFSKENARNHCANYAHYGGAFDAGGPWHPAKGQDFGCQNHRWGEFPIAINLSSTSWLSKAGIGIGFFDCLSKLAHIPSPSTQ